MSEWRPMETAPKDCTPILVFEPGARYGSLQEEPDEIRVAFWRRTGFVRQEDKHIGVNATHWMPLPKAPQSEDGAA